MKENYSNFATSTLATPSPLTSTGLTFTCAAGQGSAFPLANFLCTIDTEVMLIASRSSDTFTVSQRGFDGTSAASHSVGATVQHCVTQYTLQHLWQNLPDAYNPDTPPAHVGSTASQWDNEFESQGSWTLYPTSLSGTAAFNMNSTLKSHLFMARNGSSGDNQLYSAYISFTPSASTPFTVTCKLSEGLNVPQVGGQRCETHLFVSDQTNPTGGPDTGNRVRMDTVVSATASNNAISADTERYARCSRSVNGAWNSQGPSLTVASNAPVYLRLNYDGAGRWRGFFGDGIIYWLTADFSHTFSFQTLGIQFAAYPSAGNTVFHAAAVDWIRIVMGSAIFYQGT